MVLYLQGRNPQQTTRAPQVCATKPPLGTRICGLSVQGLSTPLLSLSTNVLNPQALLLLPEEGPPALTVQVTSVPAYIWEVSSPGEVGPSHSQNSSPGLKALEGVPATVFTPVHARISQLGH